MSEAASLHPSKFSLISVPDALDLEIEFSGPEGVGCLQATQQEIIEASVVSALGAGISGPLPPAEIFVQLVDDDKSHGLNQEYRGKEKPTNVLSFPGVEPDDLPDMLKQAAQGGPPVLLGDLVIASSVVAAEAEEQNKSFGDHLAHLTVHGVLHLLGYDHMEEDAANEMEELERSILSTLGISDPYEAES
ncbi:MAG: rRNA maturation RNase YbeY [Kordiimonadales bacterium]|nr:MAG: rRNA maturation RNase YbeY [Kordiimonadales bacterium]